ncbi:Neutral protease 2 [Venturia inaequalis]|nr:Neutral protease 2 [Venturia inaequalis]
MLMFVAQIYPPTNFYATAQNEVPDTATLAPKRLFDEMASFPTSGRKRNSHSLGCTLQL